MNAWQQTFHHVSTGKSSPSLAEIHTRCSAEEKRLSPDFFERYPKGLGTGVLSPFTGITLGPGPLAHGKERVQRALTREREAGGNRARSLEIRLSEALAARLPVGSVAVAVSGGVDSWLLAALLKRLGYSVCGWYLETDLPGYCERKQVERSSRLLGIECQYLRADVQDFVEAAAAFTAAVQWPVYNLHPVSKWLLARALRERGVTTLVTGDAADQVMRWDWDCDLLPLTLACFRQAGVDLVLPFLSDEVLDLCRRPDAAKTPVRELARQLGVPTVAKHPTLFPPVPLPRIPQAALPPTRLEGEGACNDRIACLAFTTGLLQQSLETH